MKAIIIQDSDARALLDQLKLGAFQNSVALSRAETKEQIQEAMHAHFHYIVCRWLQEQGANVVR